MEVEQAKSGPLSSRVTGRFVLKLQSVPPTIPLGAYPCLHIEQVISELSCGNLFARPGPRIDLDADLYHVTVQIRSLCVEFRHCLPTI